MKIGTIGMLGLVTLLGFVQTAGASARDDAETSWVMPSLGYQVGYTELGTLYGASGNVVQGPTLGIAAAVEKKKLFFGGELQLPVLLGLGSLSVMPYAGLIVGGDLGALRLWVGGGVEDMVIGPSNATYGHAWGVPFHAGFTYLEPSGVSFGAELSLRKYYFKGAETTTIVPNSGLLLTVSVPFTFKRGE